MNIGIIGAGAMAQAICKHTLNSGHSVMLSNSRGPQTLNQLVGSLGCSAGTITEAAEFGDIVIIAIPLGMYRTLPTSPLTGKITLDLLNYFPHRDGVIPELQRGEITTSELLARHIPNARLVKALNSITVEDLRKDNRPVGAPERRAIPIAGNDIEAKEVTARFINDIGFDVVDGGDLSDSWRFERFRPVYCVALDKESMMQTLASTTRDTRVPDGYWLYNRRILK
ncbi:NADPH-dependent F420 reductase [Xenorhabdus bovienii]|uniref:NADPH-dependent F420 reductase n=1 Tax=Xenorhabdus bovienii TaxID=40576 RepID=UPI003DA58AB2